MFDQIRAAREIAQLQEDGRARDARLREVEAAIVAAAASASPEAGDQLLKNGEAEFSDDAYNDLGLGGDSDELAAHWYIHPDTDTLLTLHTADLVKSSGHSGYSAGVDSLDWEKSAGRFRLGSLKTLSQPLTNRFAQAGNVLYLQFTATLSTASALPAGFLFYGGIHDNTAGREDWLPGATLRITATVEGASGAASLDYVVIVTTDKGEVYQITMAAPLATAPASLTAANYVRLSWPAVPGATSQVVYKQAGAVFTRLTTITSGSNEFNDIGAVGATVGAFPTATLSALRARVQDDAFAPEFGVIKAYAYAIKVPSDYDISLTTGEQILRLGVSPAPTDAHQLMLDRFQLGFNFGGFQRAAADLAVTNGVSISASPTGGLEGPPNSSGGDAPGVGSGGARFFLEA